MLRESNRFSGRTGRASGLSVGLSAGLALVGALAFPSIAAADEVSVTLAEDPGGVTVRIRGVAPDASADHIVTSKTGALLFVPGDEAMPQRLRPLERHRLDYVQIGRAGERVAVRVVQRKKAKGTLTKSMHTTPVPGGFDVRIEDNTGVTTVGPTANAPAAATFDRGAALSKIVGDPVPLPAPVAAPVPAPAPPTVTAVAPLPQVAAAVTAPTPALGDAPIEAEPPMPAPRPPVDTVDGAADEANLRWAAAATQQAAPIDLARSAPQIGLAWLATAMLAFSGLGLLWWRRRRPMLETPQPLRVLARVGIGPKQQIVWISAGGRSLLVGATEQRIDLLADLSAPGVTAPAPIEAPMTSFAAAPAPTPAPDGRIAAFKQRLRAALGDELAGRNEEPVLPPHLEMLTGDPRWVGRKESA